MHARRLVSTLQQLGLWLFLLFSATHATATCDFTRGQAAVDGGNMVYNRYGQGPAILLLHGLFADKEQWHGLACALAAAGYSAIVPDLPGYGQSTGFPLPDYRLEAQANLLHQLMQGLGIARHDIAGSSMGGAIAAIYTRVYPRAVRSLAFIGSPLGIIEWSPEVQAAITEGVNPFIPIDVAQFDMEMRLLFVTPLDIPVPAREMAVQQYVTRNWCYQRSGTSSISKTPFRPGPAGAENRPSTLGARKTASLRLMEPAHIRYPPSASSSWPRPAIC